MTVSQLCLAISDFCQLYPNQTPCVPVSREGESPLVGTARYVADALDRRGRELERAVRETQAELTCREEWLAQQSHEVRNPMQAVLGTLELLVDRETDSTKRDEMEVAIRASRHLCEKLNQMLDYSKAAQEDLPPVWEDIPVRELIRDTVLLYRANAVTKGVELNLHLDDKLPAVLSGDGDRLKRLLVNLVSNAIKFTPQGSVDVLVQFRELPGHQSHLAIEVRDTGIGISAENQQKLFRPYVQADPSIARQYGGTGLGLVICKRLVERAGGTIAVSSEPGKGTQCRFVLPVKKLAEAQAPAPPSPEVTAAEPIHASRVLLAEDEAAIRRIARTLLERLGFQVDEAEDGEQAVRAAGSGIYSVVFMDLTMPGMGGLDAARAIRQGTGPSSQVPIVALTGRRELEVREACLEAGMNSYVTKPFGIQEVRQVMEQLQLSA